MTHAHTSRRKCMQPCGLATCVQRPLCTHKSHARISHDTRRRKGSRVLAQRMRGGGPHPCALQAVSLGKSSRSCLCCCSILVTHAAAVRPCGDCAVGTHVCHSGTTVEDSWLTAVCDGKCHQVSLQWHSVVTPVSHQGVCQHEQLRAAQADLHGTCGAQRSGIRSPVIRISTSTRWSR